MIGTLFRRWVLGHAGLCFLVMCLSFAGFGIGSLNLFYMLSANLHFIADNGVMGLADGGAWQLLELLLTLCASNVSYIVFKTCEHTLVARWSRGFGHRED